MSSLVTTVFKLRWRRDGMARRQLEAAAGGQKTCQSGTKVRGTAPRILTGNIVQPVLFQSFWMSLWVVAVCVFFRVSHWLLPSVIFSTQDSFGKWSWLWYEFGQPCICHLISFLQSQFVEEGFKKTVNLEHSVVLLLFLFILGHLIWFMRKFT